jgi:DNA-directed RNA polymerase subunit A'
MLTIKKQIKGIQLSLLSPAQIKKLAKVKIITPELYDVDGYPVDGGLMDLRMGAIDPGVKCRTCGGSFKECLGHFGYIELARPVLHIHFIPLIELLLRTTCEECGRILTTKQITKAEVKGLRTVKRCPHCNAPQSKIKLEKPYFFYKGSNRLMPTEIRAWLEKIPDEDLKVYGINPKTFRPENAVLTALLVPPVTVRPSITLETGERSEDDLTHKLNDIVRSNQRLLENINAGAADVIIEDMWDLLQYHVATFFDNEIAQLPPARHRSGHVLKTLGERIKGKEGIIRHNLAGKRVNFSSRTVISPDPNININEVGIPYEVARVLTYPEKVTQYNKEYLKKLIENFPNYPSARSIIRPNGQKKKITEETKQEILEELDVGYVVERHIMDGDIVLFNRQPTLHRASIMGHFVKVLKGKTFRLHPAICFPYNADFDGDEMNVHFPQTPEAIVEARVITNAANMIISPKNNTNLIGCIREAITGCYLLSKATLAKEDAVQLLINAGIDIEQIPDWPEEVSGREIFSVLLPKELNLELKTRECKGKGCELCDKPNSPCKLVIKNGKILRGALDANAIGVEKDGLVKALDKILPSEQVLDIIKKIFGLGIEYVSKIGFSFGLSDVKPSDELRKEVKKVIEKAYRKSDEIIESYRNRSLEILPGRTLEETREIKLLQVLNEARTEAGEKIKAIISEVNPVKTLITSGAVGNIVHLIQVSGIIGQQALWARRINIGYKNRTFSCFEPNDLGPEAHGFIDTNYYDGLNAYQFVFGCVTGRDSLMDTALRTPKSGYLYRRLVNAMQDFRVEYDGTVRDSWGKIIQFAYGGDGVDVSKAHKPFNKIEPAEAVGIVTSQSFGEPATQMTLNVFHFAGISEMQITVGLPRLIEIFDARKEPTTPQMEIYLEKDYNNENGAKKIAEKIKEVKLKEVIEEISVDYANRKIKIVFDKKALKDKGLSMDQVIDAIKAKDFKKTKTENSLVLSEQKEKEGKLSRLYSLKEKLKESIIGGIKGITQVLIVQREKDFVILTAGSNLEEVLEIKGVDKERTVTNNIFEMQKVFGIEAAREMIVREVKKVLKEQGLDINERHIQLIADAMTASGEIKGTTRTGIVEEKRSVLARASFEIPIKHFVRSIVAGYVDELCSVIENVMLNQPVPVGTGLPGLLVKVTDARALALPPKQK